MQDKQYLNPFAQIVDPFNHRAGDNQQALRDIEEETKSMVVSVFSTPEGMRLLDRWDDLYLRQPVCPVGCAEGYGYARSAINEFIVKIRRTLNEAEAKSQPRYLSDKQQ